MPPLPEEEDTPPEEDFAVLPEDTVPELGLVVLLELEPELDEAGGADLLMTCPVPLDDFGGWEVFEDGLFVAVLPEETPVPPVVLDGL